MNRVMVIGAGVAGTAAALTAAQAGAHVTVIDGGTGASTLSTGAIDSLFWQKAPAQPAQLAPLARATLDALGGYVLPDAGARLLTIGGITRPARGHDAAILDVESLASTRIGVVQCPRPGWNGQALARAWGDNYAPIDAVIIRHSDEKVLPDADFAMRHDDEERLLWLAERLREALVQLGGAIGALVLPPSLGIERARADALSKLVGVRCGEAIGEPGGPSGLRFERARDRALAAAEVDHVRERASSVRPNGRGWRVATEGGSVSECDTVVLASGSLIGGGIEYAPAESMVASALPPFACLPFRLTIDAPLTLGAHGRPLELPSTLFGYPPESIAWPFVRDALADHVGVASDGDGRAGPGLFVAGDLQADRPRTWLGVLAAGVAAGAAAARGRVTGGAEMTSPGAAPPMRS